MRLFFSWLHSLTESELNVFLACAISFPDFLISQLFEKEGTYWIGLHRFSGGNGEFGWADNSPVTYTNWARYEPNGGDAVSWLSPPTTLRSHNVCH